MSAPSQDSLDCATSSAAEYEKPQPPVTAVVGGSSGIAEVPLCKHWQRRGDCIFADTCKFRHPPAGSFELLTPKIADGVRRQAGGRVKVRNGNKCEVFRRFLLDTFGHQLMMGGVLDVAGGKGETSFALVNLCGIPACVVDPRPLDLRGCCRRWDKGLYHRTAPLQKYNANSLPAGGPSRPPRHARSYFEEYWWREFGADEESVDLGRSLHQRASAEARLCKMTYTGEGHADEEAEDTEVDEAALLLEQNDTTLGSEWLPTWGYDLAEPTLTGSSKVDGEEDFIHPQAQPSYEAVRGLAAKAAILIGLHPDQAVGHIVDCALALRKPFAVVPCCTHAKLFPDRKTPDGSPVRSYEELLQYLQAKHLAIQRALLDFEGRNVVLYAHATDL
eukprot:NODE_2994_length_1299_cov_119.084184_g2842_i0.p1 GENE.NODE_2994_length_1299_cov_119.084184_g2842_i0~~NODE_2994_length_1299_cov_119.084184_g2842_i0.p1  ORF type:complete len:389 (+),score=30.44 NODE_2994_length_1299_cov_119.084184_g2842_i0:71-1237(+)